ncbi:MAG: glycosyltransferase family 2 protein [Gemmatimonadetes bacterium]|nr:glycosyltransferase family 2 protein [Gemmatimonadota bacterium]
MSSVSVIVPTYNRLSLLRLAVDSVLQQTHGELELIVADDSSTDETQRYIAGLTDPRVRYLTLPHTGNVAQIRNEGARAARGEYLAFLDSDDLWAPQKLEVQLSRMQDGCWSHTQYELIDAEGIRIPFRAGASVALSGWIARDVIVAEAAPALATVLLRRTAFEKIGGFDEDTNREDYAFLLRLALAWPTVGVPECLAYVRHHTGRRTERWSGPESFIGFVHIYTRLLSEVQDVDLCDLARQRLVRNLLEMATALLTDGRSREALGCLLRAARNGAGPRHCAAAAVRGLGRRHYTTALKSSRAPC